MKFLTIIGALFIQLALTQTVQEYKDAQAMANVAQVLREQQQQLANKLTHLNLEQQQRYRQLVIAQREFKASLKGSN